MKRVLVLIVAILGLAIATTPAGAVSPQQKRIAALEKRTTALESQVKALQASLKIVAGGLDANFASDACDAAMTADLFQATWTAVDANIGKVVFGAQTPVTDYNACSDLELTRTTAQPLPTLIALNSLIGLIWGP